MATDEKTSLLTLEERAICERVSTRDQPPHNQRAQALLALDEGLSQIEASERTGLTAGQVRYWLSKFRQQRADIFPQELQAHPTPVVQAVPAEVPEEESEAKSAETVIEQAQPATIDEKAGKKSKKAKGKKKKSKKVKEKSSKKKKKKGSKKIVAKKAKKKKKKKSKKDKKGKK